MTIAFLSHIGWMGSSVKRTDQLEMPLLALSKSTVTLLVYPRFKLISRTQCAAYHNLIINATAWKSYEHVGILIFGPVEGGVS